MRQVTQVCLVALALGACSSSTPDEGGGTGPGVLPPPTTITPTGMAGAASPPPTTVTPPPVTTPPPTTVMPPPVVTPPADPMVVPPVDMPATMGKLAMDECGLATNYDGDEFCINPPPADKGFQIHIGPSNYDNPEPQYVLEPGVEVTDTFPATSGNDQQVYYYWRQYRMRPGSHHLIVSEGIGRRLGGSSNSAKDNPEGGVIAEENKGVGMPLSAHAALSNSFHTFNFTDKAQIKEGWVNFWYRDASLVTEPTKEVFSMLGMGIAPGEHVNAHGTCNITGSGRFLTVYGHVHSHNKRFSVWRTRGTDKKLIHEAYDWEHPGISEFSSTVTNPTIDAVGKIDGGFSGIVDLAPGDKIDFECDILNDTNSVFIGRNEANNDEMCILVGDTVGTAISPACTAANIPAN